MHICNICSFICKTTTYYVETVQLIGKTTNSYLENSRRSYPYNRDTLLAATRPTARHFRHFKSLIFTLWKSRLKITTKSLNDMKNNCNEYEGPS